MMRRYELVQRPRGLYRVLVAGVEVGQIERCPDLCWSYAPWRVVGDTTKSAGGVRGASYRLRGWSTRWGAAHEAAVMGSGRAIAALCAERKEG